MRVALRAAWSEKLGGERTGVGANCLAAREE